MTLRSTTASIDNIDGSKSVLDVFGDPDITKSISEKLYKHSENDTVTQSELSKIKYLSQRWKSPPANVFDITRLQYLNNLTWLFLINGGITDVEPISELTNLCELFLPNNEIVDIQPLSKLENLISLDLSHNLISDITPLHKMKNLRHLYLIGNKIRDVSPLGSLENLECLCLYWNPITTMSSLKYLKNLTEFWHVVMYFPKEVYQEVLEHYPSYNQNKSKGFFRLLYDKIMGRKQ